MYCTLKYPADLHRDSSNSTLSNINSSRTQLSTEFKELIFNPDCYVGILLDYICEELGFEKDITVSAIDIPICKLCISLYLEQKLNAQSTSADLELYDETGFLTNITSCKKWTYATEVLQPKHTFIAVLCARYPDGMICKFQPLINRNYKDYSTVMQNLTKYLTMTKKAAQEKKNVRASQASKSSSLDARRRSAGSQLSQTRRKGKKGSNKTSKSS